MNYKGIKDSDEFQRYMTLTKELTRVEIDTASREDKLAFFINIYNALVIHANVVVGPPSNLWQRYKVSILPLANLFCKYTYSYEIKCNQKIYKITIENC